MHHELPVKIFVFDNAGYAVDPTDAGQPLRRRRVGEGSASGVSLPDMVAVAGAYGIAATRVDEPRRDFDEAIARRAGRRTGPSLLDVVMDPEQAFAPKVIAERLADGTIVSKPLEDMFPLLDRDELRAI